MKASFLSYLSDFRRNQRGAAVVVFAIGVIPVLGLVGAGIDYSRATSARTELQNALDAATLSVALDGELNESQTTNRIRERMLGHLGDSEGFSLRVSARRDVADNLIDSNAWLKIDTGILAVMGVDYIEVGAESAVSARHNELEIALVLDNTGSMRPHMRSLRTASQQFVDIVTSRGRNDNTRVALVPYIASVNIGNSRDMEQVLDKQGLSRYHATFIETRQLTKFNSCDWPTNNGGGSGPVWDNSGPSTDGASISPSLRAPILDLLGERFSSANEVLRELIGIREAAAFEPYTYTVVDNCFPANPDVISHWQLFQQVGVQWKGCVEARPEPHDVLDTVPTTNDPDTLWVPYFWMDATDEYAANVPVPTNNWVDDLPFIQDTELFQNLWGRHYSVLKYNTANSMQIDEVGPETSGPNMSCGDPIIPLTNDYRAISDGISGISEWNGGGTQTSQGVVWGWRVLSPTAPFIEGKSYDEATKVMVVMTDGANRLLSADSLVPLSHYSAYGNLRMGRMGRSLIDAEQYINQRTQAACTNAKEAGVVVYTVTFGIRDASSRRLWDDCATETSMAYHVDTASELVGAFNSIATAVGQLRLTR
ncbi:MAG: Tad domain-containing protein [Pseudomonadota bacterium]